MRDFSIGVLLLAAVISMIPAQHMENRQSDSSEEMDSMGAQMHPTEPIRTESDFIVQMIPHHLEAADAAILVNVTTGDEEIRSLTERIYTEQMKEVVDLKRTFAKLYSALPVGGEYMPMMRDLNSVSGKERDVRFVEDMIPHHRGAITMAEDVLKLSSISEETRAFARKVIADQSSEIGTMEEWLRKNR